MVWLGAKYVVTLFVKGPIIIALTHQAEIRVYYSSSLLSALLEGRKDSTCNPKFQHLACGFYNDEHISAPTTKMLAMKPIFCLLVWK